MLPGSLVGSVVGQFVLEEHRPAVFAVPDDVILLVVLHEQAVAVTWSPLMMTPLSPVLVVQPTPFPWSARQAQMWSRSTLSLLTSRLTEALPTCGPPIRKNTSWSVVGLAGSLYFSEFEGPPAPGFLALPMRISAGELTRPASTVTAAISTPGHPRRSAGRRH